MNKSLNYIKQLIVLCFLLLGMNGLVFAKLPVEKVEKDNAKVLFSQDAESSDDESSEVEDEGDQTASQAEMFDDVISQAKSYHDNLEKSNSALSPKQNLLRSMAEDNAEQAVLNRNHVETPDPLLKEGRYLYNQDVARERGKIIMKQTGREKKVNEKSLASSFSDISHHRPPKKKDDKEANTVAEYKLKAQKLSELKNDKNKKNDKKEEDRDVTYKSQAEALSTSFR